MSNCCINLSVINDQTFTLTFQACSWDSECTIYIALYQRKWEICIWRDLLYNSFHFGNFLNLFFSSTILNHFSPPVEKPTIFPVPIKNIYSILTLLYLIIPCCIYRVYCICINTKSMYVCMHETEYICHMRNMAD